MERYLKRTLTSDWLLTGIVLTTLLGAGAGAARAQTLTQPNGEYHIEGAERETQIIISGLIVNFVPEGSNMRWAVSYDHYNRTQSKNPKMDAAMYVDLIDAKGGVIPLPSPIRIYVPYKTCTDGGARHEGAQGIAGPVAATSAAVSQAIGIHLRSETITEDVGPC